jgi:hypothetical protein
MASHTRFLTVPVGPAAGAIGDPYTDTIGLWSEIASALSSLANDFGTLFHGHEFAAQSTDSTHEQPASAATAAASR